MINANELENSRRIFELGPSGSGGEDDFNWRGFYFRDGSQRIVRPETPRPMVEGEWYCVEWHFSRRAPQMQTFIDGEPLLEVSESSVAPRMERLDIGVRVYTDRASEFVMYVDDIALGRERVGCGA